MIVIKKTFDFGTKILVSIINQKTTKKNKSNNHQFQFAAAWLANRPRKPENQSIRYPENK